MSDEEHDSLATKDEEQKGQGDDKTKEGDEDGDGEVYNQSNAIIDDAKASEFKCTEPQMLKGHIEYKCIGTDSQGSWEGSRRFNVFFKLADQLEKRWPGIPVPQLPPKKAIGNKDIKFINERRYFLERWLKKISQFPFIVNSEEFQIFCRPTGDDIEKLLTKLPAITYTEIVERMREALKIEDHLYDPVQKDLLDTQSREFSMYTK